MSVSISLVLAIIPLQNNRLEKTTQPLDSPSLKILNITRHSIDRKDWKNFRRRSKILQAAIILFSSLSVIVVSTIDTYYFYNLILLKIAASIYIFVGVIISMLVGLRAAFLFTPATPFELRYKIFKDIDVLIEADYHYLFNKCHEALRSMKFIVVEVNEKTGKLEAFRQSGLFTPLARIEVRVEQVASSQATFLIRVHFGRWHSSEKEEMLQVIEKKNLAQSSKFINIFVNLLISKSKNKDDQGKSKTEMPNDGGD